MAQTIEDMMFDAAAPTMAAAPAPGEMSSPASEALVRLAELGSQQLALETRIKRGEDLLASLGRDLHKLRTETIPKAMIEARVKGFSMLDGSEVVIKKQYFGSIPTEDAIAKATTEVEREQLIDRRRRAFEWFRANGNEDIIKNEFKVPLGKGEDTIATELADVLRERGINYTQTESVHHSTLKAFVKEQMEKGRLDTDGQEALGAFVLDVTEIKPKKAGK